MATGTQWYLARRTSYLDSFLRAAASAAFPAAALDDVRLNAASVFVTVTSHVMHFPSDHGICETPSGLLPSVRTRPVGSFIEGMLALFRARKMISFNRLWRSILPDPFLHERPCVPRESTLEPQTHVCGSHNLVPKRNPTATLIASSSMRRPHDERGRAFSHSPA